MYRELLRQNRSRELVNDFLDQFIERHGWWAARAAWVSEAGMIVDPWRVSSHAPDGLIALRNDALPTTPIDPGEARFPEPVHLPVSEVRCTLGVIDTLNGEGVSLLTVVDVAGLLDFDVRLVFALPPPLDEHHGAIEALRTGAALLPTVLRQEIERDELRFGTMHDPMTGLLNRTGLNELSARLTTDRDSRAVIFIDLDGFKSVNDSHGHAAGDVVLVDAAARLTSAVRPSDLVARVGGDEFIVVAASLLDEPAAVSLAQRLSASLARDIILDTGAVVSVAASAGVTMWGESVTFDEAVEAADALMFEAKRIGGGIATQDATGRVLVRDPYSGDAPPEEVERGRVPVRVALVQNASDRSPWGVHVMLRGELCSRPFYEVVDIVNEALRYPEARGEMPRMIVEPRGRGWVRENVLLEVVAGLLAAHPTVELTVMVDSSPSSADLRLVVDELRARLGVSVALGGVGAATGGDLRALVHVAPSLLVLDREATMNLDRTRPAGVAAALASAMATTVGASLMLIDPPVDPDAATREAWGASLVATTLDLTQWSSPTADERTP
jgi:diguanylate cyclase (GGDEF)-like protein